MGAHSSYVHTVAICVHSSYMGVHNSYMHACTSCMCAQQQYGFNTGFTQIIPPADALGVVKHCPLYSHMNDSLFSAFQYAMCMFSRTVQVNQMLYKKSKPVIVTSARTHDDTFHVSILLTVPCQGGICSLSCNFLKKCSISSSSWREVPQRTSDIFYIFQQNRLCGKQKTQIIVQLI